jgi:hypothetical protein
MLDVQIYKNAIIPIQQKNVGGALDMDYEAICIFLALGFFLNDETYFNGLKSLMPGTVYQFDENKNILERNKYFEWSYTPKNMSFEEAVSSFSILLEGIINRLKDNQLTIPISGGLDSRTLLAAAVKTGKKIVGYSYRFQNGHDESWYGSDMSGIAPMAFHRYEIKKGVLWQYIDNLAIRNRCYAEFTHPRQFAFRNELSNLGGTFLLGHGGDLFFDDMGVEDKLPFDQQLNILWNRLVKPSSLALARELWQYWGLVGNFDAFLREKISSALKNIKIDNANARLRAFKSSYYVPRWTCVNLELFQDFGPNSIPYFEDEMCQFICSVPEKWLSGRKIQIEYLKRSAPGLASIPWDAHKPFNLYNYRWNRVPWNVPFRIMDKIKRLSQIEPYTQRNWELQFIGKENDAQLKERLFEEPKLLSWVPRNIIEKYYNKFVQGYDKAHFMPVTMLLTLSLFSKHFK